VVFTAAHVVWVARGFHSGLAENIIEHMKKTVTLCEVHDILFTARHSGKYCDCCKLATACYKIGIEI